MQRVEIPWTDDSQWSEIDFGWIGRSPFDEKPEGTERLDHLADGATFTDANGASYTKAADGPVQGACVVTDGMHFAQLGGDTLVRT